MLVAAYLDRSLRMWRTSDGQQCGEARLTDHPVGCFAFSPDGETIACGSLGGQITLRSARDLTLIRALNPKIETWGLAFSADASMLAAGHRDGGISLYEVHSDERRAHWNGRGAAVTELAFDDNDHSLISCDNSGAIRSWDLRELKVRLAELKLDW
jgi:WD40 repeat protein